MLNTLLFIFEHPFSCLNFLFAYIIADWLLEGKVYKKDTNRKLALVGVLCICYTIAEGRIPLE